MNRRGFTLLEVLVVLALVAATSYLLVGGLRGGKTTVLRSSQATLANFVTAARTKAAASGRKTRLLVHADPVVPERYLRLVVLQLGPPSGESEWRTVQSLFLPAGIYVVPTSLTGLVADAGQWRRGSNSGDELVSDLFANQSFLQSLEGDQAAQWWMGVGFTPNGTLAALAGGPPPKGALVIALGEPRAAGTYLAGQAPVQLEEPSQVCGLLLSAYGVPAWANGQNAF